MVDALHELFDAGERAAADGFVRNQCEESFDLVEPRAVGRDEVQVVLSWNRGSTRFQCTKEALIYEPNLHAEIGAHGGDDFDAPYGDPRALFPTPGASSRLFGALKTHLGYQVPAIVSLR